MRNLGQRIDITAALFVTTTEVDPDSAELSAEECNEAQRVPVRAEIGYLRRG